MLKQCAGVRQWSAVLGTKSNLFRKSMRPFSAERDIRTLIWFWLQPKTRQVIVHHHWKSSYAWSAGVTRSNSIKHLTEMSNCERYYGSARLGAIISFGEQRLTPSRLTYLITNHFKATISATPQPPALSGARPTNRHTYREVLVVQERISWRRTFDGG